jgi:hypothetical protein
MANDQREAARGAVIQGRFIGGRFRLPGVTSPPAPIQPRMAGAQPIQPRMAQPHVAQRQPIQPGHVHPHINQHSAHLQRIAQAKMAHPNVAQTRAVHHQAVQLRSATPQSPVVQRHGNGEAFQLPANLSSFGGRGGQPLPGAVLQKMESFFGTSFADVRVHVGPQASSIGALAFTQGSNLYFAQGQYNPHTPQGQQILGHELTHVVQQRAGRVHNPFGSGVAVVQDRSMEAEADRMGLRAASHKLPVRARKASLVPANKASSPFPVQRRQAIQRKSWKWTEATRTWDDADNEALANGAAAFGEAPNRDGEYDGEWVYVEDLTQAQINQRAAAAQREQAQRVLEEAQRAQEAQRALAEFQRLTRQPLRSFAYVWSGNRWVQESVQNGKDHEEAKKWRGFKYGPFVPSKALKEQDAYTQWAAGGGWMSFTQNAWPCVDNCMPIFRNESRTQGVNFLFNVIGDSGGYAGDHGRRGQQARGVVVIQGGVVSYALPNAITLPPDNF